MSAQRMSNADAAWLHMDRPTNLMVVNALLWFEEPVDAERIREILRSRLVAPFPRFRQLVKCQQDAALARAREGAVRRCSAVGAWRVTAPSRRSRRETRVPTR
jgi:hypothetical protein